MKKKTKIILIILISLFTAVVLFGILFILDLLPARLSASINRLFSTNRPVAQQDLESPPQNTVFVPRPLPDDLRGIWMDLNTDLKTEPYDSFSALASETNTYFNVFKNVQGNALFLLPDVTGRYAQMKDSYGMPANLNWEMLGYADLSSYYKVLVVPDALLYDAGGAMTYSQIDSYLDQYTFHAVLLDSETMRAKGESAAAAELVGKLMKEKYPDRYLGMMLYSDAAAEYATEDALRAVQGGNLDFAVIDAGGAMNSALPFRTVMNWWNTLAGNYPQMAFYCRHRNDLVLSNTGDWSNYLEINEQTRVLWNCENFRGSVYCSAAAILANKSSSTHRLSALLYDGIPDDLKIRTLTVDGANAKITFTGSASASYKLICSRTVLSNGVGSFEQSFALSPGENVFAFFNAGKRLTYRVFHNTAESGPTRAQSAAVTPYTDHSLGTTVMCRIVEQNTETLGTTSEKDTYHADYSTMPVGTLDYLSSVSLSGDGKLRYELSSGNTVFATACELISNAYTMPQNHLTVAGVDDTDPSKTVVLLQTDWFVPVNVQCLPLTYTKGYRDYSFNIAAFNASYVDVRFAHTADLSAADALTFADNAPFYASEVITENDALILRLHLRKPGQFYGYHIEQNQSGQLVLSFKKHSDGTLTGKTVMLDPGHGGMSMTGTALSDETIAEKQVTLSIALKAKQMLESYGATVLMTRFLDTPLTLEERCAILTDADPDVFVSIHCDGVDNKSQSGTHTFYFRPYSMPLAAAIHQSMVSQYQTNIYKPTDANYANIDKGIKFYPFFVTRMDTCPSVLCETGFMSNEVEGRILANDNYQYWMALGIANGIRDYFMLNY